MIEIRPAVATDAAAIATLLRALADSLGVADECHTSTQSLHRYGFGPDALFQSLLAWQEGQAVGLALYFREFSSWLCEPGVYLQDLYVAPTLRGSGLGRRLVTAVQAEVAALGVTYMRLSAHATNSEAIRFYQRLGFTLASEDRVLKLKGAAYSALRRGEGL